jgi:hypothetical protein
MKKIIILSVLLVSTFTFAQKLNAYKYAIVPEKFSFQTENNQYNFNDLVKSAMRRYGFDPYFPTEELPIDASNANKLFVDLIESNSMVYTKLNLVFRDYRNNIVFTTQDGKSKDKDFAIAYNEAFRETVKSVELMNHHYSEIVDVADNEIIYTINEIDKVSVYEARPIKNGFDLSIKDQFNFILKTTSKKDIFIAIKNQISGICLKTDNNWTFEYYKNDVLVQEKINILFK